MLDALNDRFGNGKLAGGRVIRYMVRVLRDARSDDATPILEDDRIGCGGRGEPKRHSKRQRGYRCETHNQF